MKLFIFLLFFLNSFIAFSLDSFIPIVKTQYDNDHYTKGSSFLVRYDLDNNKLELMDSVHHFLDSNCNPETCKVAIITSSHLLNQEKSKAHLNNWSHDFFNNKTVLNHQCDLAISNVTNIDELNENNIKPIGYIKDNDIYAIGNKISSAFREKSKELAIATTWRYFSYSSIDIMKYNEMLSGELSFEEDHINDIKNKPLFENTLLAYNINHNQPNHGVWNTLNKGSFILYSHFANHFDKSEVVDYLSLWREIGDKKIGENQRNLHYENYSQYFQSPILVAKGMSGSPVLTPFKEMINESTNFEHYNLIPIGYKFLKPGDNELEKRIQEFKSKTMNDIAHVKKLENEKAFDTETLTKEEDFLKNHNKWFDDLERENKNILKNYQNKTQGIVKTIFNLTWKHQKYEEIAGKQIMVVILEHHLDYFINELRLNNISLSDTKSFENFFINFINQLFLQNRTRSARDFGVIFRIEGVTSGYHRSLTQSYFSGYNCIKDTFKKFKEHVSHSSQELIKTIRPKKIVIEQKYSVKNNMPYRVFNNRYSEINTKGDINQEIVSTGNGDWGSSGNGDWGSSGNGDWGSSGNNLTNHSYLIPGMYDLELDKNIIGFQPINNGKVETPLYANDRSLTYLLENDIDFEAIEKIESFHELINKDYFVNKGATYRLAMSDLAIFVKFDEELLINFYNQSGELKKITIDKNGKVENALRRNFFLKVEFSGEEYILDIRNLYLKDLSNEITDYKNLDGSIPPNPRPKQITSSTPKLIISRYNRDKKFYEISETLTSK